MAPIVCTMMLRAVVRILLCVDPRSSIYLGIWKVAFTTAGSRVFSVVKKDFLLIERG